ncbi:Serine/threonine-protein phosphatase [Mycena venus]|uniref:non-specific serine/threonine protein kinase n=1 Tax=Mycena venus TaxID=2733690 RepID=A0A8H6YDR6_9AGAR|nr:Serine/threonine-protein phosphatase [Mycena venus]
MIPFAIRIVTCLSSILTHADSIRCRAIIASRRAVDSAVLVVVGAVKAQVKRAMELPPSPTKTWPLFIPPTRSSFVSYTPPIALWILSLLVGAITLYMVASAIGKIGAGCKTRRFSWDVLPGSTCMLHPGLACYGVQKYDVQKMLQTALPASNVLLDASPSRLRCPRVLGGLLRLVKELGFGGFGDVIKVRSLAKRQNLAVKRISKHKHIAETSTTLSFFDSKGPRRSVLNEIAVYLLMHNNAAIPSLHGTFHDQDYYYLVMDCARAFDEACIRSRKIALSYGRQLALALLALHERGIVHSDVKPDNLLLAPDGRLMVIDFGLAQMFNMHAPPAALFPRWHDLRQQALLQPGNGHFPLLWSDEDNPHRTRLCGGTPGYISLPVRRGDLVSYGSDLYGFACVLDEWLAKGISAEGQDLEMVSEVDTSFFDRILSQEKPLRFESWRKVLDHPIWTS